MRGTSPVLRRLRRCAGPRTSPSPARRRLARGQRSCRPVGYATEGGQYPLQEHGSPPSFPRSDRRRNQTPTAPELQGTDLGGVRPPTWENGRIRAWALLPSPPGRGACCRPARCGGPPGRDRPRRALRAGRPPRRAARGVRAGRAVRAAGRRRSSSTSRPSRCAGPGAAATSSRSGRPPTTSPAGSTSTTSTSPETPSTRAAPTSCWARRTQRGRGAGRLRARRRPTPAIPGELALQYWLFYAFNDWNNLHEGDWEMIQLLFDAEDARGGARARADEDRLQPARGRRAGRLGRGQARARRRHASGRAPGRRLARELLRRGALPRQLGRAGRRLRRHDAARTSTYGRPCSRSRATRRGAGRRSRGSTSRAAGASCSARSTTARPGPNLKTQWTEPDRLVGRLARPELRGAGRRRARDRAPRTSSATPSAAARRRFSGRS